MKRLRSFALIIIFLGSSLIWGGCISGKNTTNVHRPVKHRKPYDPKKNRNSKRVRIIKMKRVG